VSHQHTTKVLILFSAVYLLPYLTRDSKFYPKGKKAKLIPTHDICVAVMLIVAWSSVY
jgi:hypothetical protein